MIENEDTDLVLYLRLERDLLTARESEPDESKIERLEAQMDDVWYRLSERARNFLNERSGRVKYV